MKSIVTSLLLLCASFSLFAQESGVVSGTVKDALTGELLPQANVTFGSTYGTYTDFSGVFSLTLPHGTYPVEVSYVGYQAYTQTITLSSQELSLNISLEGVVLDQAEIIADYAIERETPVAFTNVLPAQIKEELGSQQIPMILNSTPGVYATPAGSGDGTARVSIRGFKQRNVAVLFDGIPVNDMENGAVYWSNWFGADLIMRGTQVQRGLGASKLTVPAIGGTINITTKNIDSKRSFRTKLETGSQNMFRSSIGFNSGRLENGWGVTLGASYMDQGGWFDQTFTKASFYFVKLEKQFDKHLLSFTAFGAPTDQGNSGNRNPISTYSKDYARGLFKGNEDLYNRMSTFNQAALANSNGDLSSEDYQAVAQSTGFVNANGEIDKDLYFQYQTENDFIDTAHVVEGGLKYNNHWGKLARIGEDTIPLNERQRKYHKPLISLKHTWAANRRLTVNTIAYYSQGIGGGTGRAPGVGAENYDENLQIAFQRDYTANTVGNIFGPPIDNTYSPTELKSGTILHKTYNNHYWLGVLSSANFQINEQWRLNAGVDLRTYESNSFREVFDLIGGDYYIGPADEWNENETEPQQRIKKEGDVISFNSNSYVKWAGIYSLLEYKQDPWSVFINVTGVNNWYRRRDFFLERETNDQPSTTTWKQIPGGTIKAGANYNISGRSSVFGNLGYLSRTPQFRNVVDFTNNFFRDIQNERIKAAELGYNFGTNKLAISVNSYYTIWENRPLDGGIRVTIDDRSVRANINAMDALHMGVEVGGNYKVNKMLDLDMAFAYGDWRWTSSDSVNFFDDSRNLVLDETGEILYRSFDAKGVLVGDAPQLQLSGAARFSPIKRLYLKPRLTYFDRYYADFDPLGLSDEKAGKQSWKIPAYSLLDIHAGYTYGFDKFDLGVSLSVFNALNTTYIADAQNNAGNAITILDNGYNPLKTVRFDANSAGVIMGYGRRFNVSLEFTLK